jgi:hypothetical protein
MTGPLDLGHDHRLRWTSWAPDRDLNPQHADLPDVERFGAILWHRRGDGHECEGSITFDGEVARQLGIEPRWTVEAWEPLTLSPSILALCGDHGHIRGGRWVPA